jgi:hypothetical protein
MNRRSPLLWILVLLTLQCSQSYQPPQISRRRVWIQHVSTFTVGLLSRPPRAMPVIGSTSSDNEVLIDSIRDAQKTLGLLFDELAKSNCGM